MYGYTASICLVTDLLDVVHKVCKLNQKQYL